MEFHCESYVNTMFLYEANLVKCERSLPSATKLRQGNISTPVCHSVHGGGHAWWGACMAGGMRGMGAAYVAWGSAWQGACVTGGCVWQGGMRGMHTPPPDTTRYGQWAGGTRPTGMHTCFQIKFSNQHLFLKIWNADWKYSGNMWKTIVSYNFTPSESSPFIIEWGGGILLAYYQEQNVQNITQI